MKYLAGRGGALVVAVGLLAIGFAGTATPADAAVIAQTGPAGALAIAQAIAAPATTVTGASFVAKPPGGTPDGTSTAPFGGFPASGSSFGILTSGNVNSVPNTATFANADDLGGPVRGSTDLDVTILKADLSVPNGANCLTFDFKFLSEEYPGFVSSLFNDAFIAELDSSTWTTSGSAISAPRNFAFDSSNRVVSINSTGLGGLSAANGSGTAFNGTQSYNANGFGPPGNAGGATGLLRASTQVTPGSHSVYFSIFDQGDRNLDSAVFLNNLVTGFVPNPAVNCVPGATPLNFKLALAPATGTDPVGTPHTVTATLTSSTGSPIPSAPILFTVSGVNPTTGTNTTNGSGVTTFTYTGVNVGTDVISACYQPSGSPPCAATASATEVWTQQATSLKYNGATTSDFNDPATLGARLVDSNGSPISGQSVNFTMASESCPATTDINGQANCPITPSEPSGIYTVTASFAGSAMYLASSTSAPFTVTKEQTTTRYTGDTQIANGRTATLSAVLKEDGTIPIAGRTVTLTLGSGSNAQTCSGPPTDAAGTTSCTVVVAQPAGVTSVGVIASFAGDNFYLPSSDTATVRLEYMTGRAFGASATVGFLRLLPTPDTGQISTSTAGTTSTPCVATVTGIISAHALCANVTTSVNPGNSTSKATVADATVGLLFLPTVQVRTVEADSTSTCSGSTGLAKIALLTIGATTVAVNATPAANTKVNVAGIQVILNEQVPFAGGLTVNAVHIIVPGVADVILASATSDIHNCQ